MTFTPFKFVSMVVRAPGSSLGEATRAANPFFIPARPQYRAACRFVPRHISKGGDV
jgi:hypothetical protein